MGTFVYDALNSSGKQQSGTVEAASAEAAVQQIRGQGLFPTSVNEQKGAKKAVTAESGPKKKKGGASINIGGVSKKKLTLFTRQLSTLQDASLPLLRSLQILEDMQKAGKLKSTLGDVCDDVEGGMALSEAFAKHPKVFDKLYSKMVGAGEVGGVLDVILQRLAEFMEKAESLKRKIKGAMIYPIAVVSIATLIVIAIMVFIIPKFKEVFTDFGMSMPVLTLQVIKFSSWTAGTLPGQSIPGWAILIVTPILFVFTMKMIRMAEPGRAMLDWIKITIPVSGNLIRKTITARFTRTLGTLITAGVPILEAVLITRDTSGNYVFEKALNGVHDSIREGEAFAEPLRESKVCDAIVVNMIAVGEETGDLDTMLMKVADNYDEEVDVAVAGLIKLIEPLLIVVLGLVVGTIVVAMFVPLISIIDNLQGGF